MANDSDDYHLSRHHAASARLNLQHYLWLTTFSNHLLSPKIPVDDEQLKVADIATGTGIWLLDFARQHPRAAQLDGFDISLDQVPSTAWLPSNVSFHQYNVHEQPPNDLLERYDIIHVRHLNLIIKNDDPTAVLGHLLAMLRNTQGPVPLNESVANPGIWWASEPGGYLQWGEFDLRGFQIAKANQDTSTTHLEELRRKCQRFNTGGTASWPDRLGDVLIEAGLQDVAFEGKWLDHAYLGYHMNCTFLVFEELVERTANSGKATSEENAELWAELAKAAAETQEGATWNFRNIIAVGRKPA
ncbi:MAG: hypothetical protein Q9188_001953, partial [Gyalolechia gomerana]